MDSDIDRFFDMDQSGEDRSSASPFVKPEPFDDAIGVDSPMQVPMANPGTRATSSPNPWDTPPRVGAGAASLSHSPSGHRVLIKPDPDHEVNQDPGPPASETAPENPKQTYYLDRLINHKNLEVLESGVSIGVDLLDQLKVQLSTFKTPDGDAWLDSIEQLKERAKPIRSVIGVVGNTGAGKSSVINGVLDEERLLPTNCLRACTASPTEISYNYSDNPDELYRAEIEFITSAEWLRELEVLFSDLLDGNGQVSRDCTNPDSEAGVAYAKLKAVYPAATKEVIASGTPDGFAHKPSVQGVLGSIKTLKSRSAKELYSGLQMYVDSKEKMTGNDHRKQNRLMEYWPLIKAVRIYTKANALSTGAVIVDLPGVQDSNAARAAVADKYMKACTGLWIVAPITRAVDDKTAKSLLGESFKRQLKYDGTYSAVSFICSKTDDISITEAVDSLGLEEEISEAWNRVEELENTGKSHQLHLKELKIQKALCSDDIDGTYRNIDVWEDLQRQAEDGEEVYRPSDNPKKRKRPTKQVGSRKKRGTHDSDTDSESDAFEHDDTSDKENSPSSTNREPLTLEDIEEALASFKAQRREMRQTKRELDEQIADIRKQMKEVKAERSKILADIKARCIQGRNEYSREAIKLDFASGIKELDQENAAEEDEAAFNPDEDLRDYDEVARSLPVFCVSSRAYQMLSGRLQKDDFQGDGFMSVEDTEIPQLQQHAIRSTEAGRASHYRGFLNELVQLINSLGLWTANDGTQSTLTDVEKRREEMHLRRLLNDLEKGFETSVQEAVQLLHESLRENIYRVFESTIPQAVNAATNTAAGWGAPKASGGMVWSTYKATVRRQGVYCGAAGPRDFNQELFDPISRSLATGWERAFQRRLPAVLDQFVVKTKAQLQAFHEAAQNRARQRHTNVSGITTLSNQIKAHERSLDQLPLTLRATITDLQREASREFTPAICHAMMYAYDVCVQESGAGSYNRMKTAMINHVEHSRNTMFEDATNTVKEKLEAMCRSIRQQMDDQMEDMFSNVFRDYTRVLVGAKVERHVKLDPKELAMRAGVNDVLVRSNSLFSPVLGELDTENTGLEAMPAPGPDPKTEDETTTGKLSRETTPIKPEVVNGAVVGAETPVAIRTIREIQSRESSASRAEADDLMQQQILAESQLINE
ncbi:hypothetical protein GGR53DRAFT_508668 [Hypoxylon sp. FL1150]|nr:hypothetical protein GGR53DRAFT_508668 [Hypoxylon sp. FL1150]